MGSIARPSLVTVKIIDDGEGSGPKSGIMVYRSQVDSFGEQIVESCMRGGMRRFDFSLGIAAAVDAIANGRLDILRPIETVAMLQHDVYSVNACKRPQATDVMDRYCRSLGGGSAS
ncbi:hypothetical protein [Eggerthella timonensis]|uniref:hypothetical protein n=1 Tax=Eggerthella timonensis TaxID=1871008 RepID=UPI0015E08BF9|nr:hypothetical protein [Eggerthella timonensis]